MNNCISPLHVERLKKGTSIIPKSFMNETSAANVTVSAVKCVSIIVRKLLLFRCDGKELQI